MAPTNNSASNFKMILSVSYLTSPSRSLLDSLEEMMEALNAARRPPESPFSVPQIGHDVTVLPATLFRAWAAQVARWGRAIVNGSQSKGVVEKDDSNKKKWTLSFGHSQMPDFMSSNDDSAEATGVLDDGHAVDLLQPLVHHTGTSHVGKACCRMSRVIARRGSSNSRMVKTRNTLIHFLLAAFRIAKAV